MVSYSLLSSLRQVLRWWEQLSIEQSNSYTIMGSTYSTENSEPSTSTNCYKLFIGHNSWLISINRLFTSSLLRTATTLYIQSIQKVRTQFFFYAMHPVWWTSDNYRNSSFRIYHVDSVFSFSLVWPLFSIPLNFAYKMFEASTNNASSGTSIFSTVLCTRVLHDELWTNGRTDCVRAAISRNTKSVQTLWR